MSAQRLPQSDEAREIRALQIAAEPDFEANHDALYKAMLEAQSRIRVCPEPEYGLLVAKLTEARTAFEQHGRRIVKQVRCRSSLAGAELALNAQIAATEAKAERHREVDRDAQRRRNE